MLKQRLATAAVLIPLVLLAVIWLPNRYFALLLGGIVVLAALEWARLSGFKRRLAATGYAGLLACLCFFLFFSADNDAGLSIILAAVFWWCAASLWVIGYQLKLLSLPRQPLILAFIGILVLLPAWLSLVLLQQQDVSLLLLLLVMIWGADSAAYFAGGKWGKHRLASRVSPGKSWQGVMAALFVTLLLALVYTALKNMDKISFFVFPALCLLTVIGSILGDLFESMVKRSGNHKDSGGLLPGHGGVLDRIDSLTAAAPLFFSALYWTGHWS